MTSDDHQLAARLADEAGHRLLALRAQGGDPADLRKAGDRSSHEFLMAELAARRPGDAVLSEEGVDNPVRLAASRVWIVDPLDGTREFGETERDDWAVHVALWESGQLTAGAVALPSRRETLSTAAPPPTPPAPGAGGGRRELRVVCSRTRPPAFLEQMRDVADITLVPMGSAGAKAATVIRGQADAYIHGGGQYEWDSAAPVAVAQAAGLHCSRLDGSALTYNERDPLLPDILICLAPLASFLVDAISAARKAAAESQG